MLQAHPCIQERINVPGSHIIFPTIKPKTILISREEDEGK